MATWIAFRSLATDIPTPARPLHADVDDYKWSLEALMVVEMKRRTRLWSKCFWVVISAALRLAEECKCAPPQIRTNYKYYTLKDNELGGFQKYIQPPLPPPEKDKVSKVSRLFPNIKEPLRWVRWQNIWLYITLHDWLCFSFCQSQLSSIIATFRW